MAPLSLAGYKLLLNGLEFAGSADEAGTEAYERARSSADALEGGQCLLGAPFPEFQGRIGYRCGDSVEQQLNLTADEARPQWEIQPVKYAPRQVR